MIRSLLCRLLLPFALVAWPSLAGAASPAWPPRLPSLTRGGAALAPSLDPGRAFVRAFSAERTPPAPTATVALDGTWREYGLLQCVGHPSFVDEPTDRLLVLGGNRRDAWSLSLTGSASWSLLGRPNTPHWPGFPALTAFDQATRTIHYVDALTTYNGVLGYPEVESMDLNSLQTSTLATQGEPPPFVPDALLLDAARQRLIVPGGEQFPTPGFDPRVWVLDLSGAPTWSELPTGAPPPFLWSLSTFVLDAVRERVLAFDVPDPASPTSESVWALSLDASPTWVRISTSALPAASRGIAQARVVSDRAADRLYTLDDSCRVYAYSFATNDWSALEVTPGPHPRYSEGLALDPARHRLLLTGGSSLDGSDVASDAWAYDLDAPRGWTPLVPDVVRPPIRSAAADAYDSSRNRLVVFGGADASGYAMNDSWALTLGAEPTWAALATAGTPPSPRFFASSAWDEAHDRMIVAGGMATGGTIGTAPPDVWQLSFAESPARWSPVAPAGPGPSGAAFGNLVYDTVRDRFLYLFGSDDSRVYDEVWELRLQPAPSWRRMHPAGPAIPARGAAMALYDATRDRVVAFGGGGNFTLYGDTWALDLSTGDGTWVPLPAAHAPSGRNLAVMQLDRSRDRLLLFGGYGITRQDSTTTEIAWLDDTWTLPLTGASDWRPLSPAGVAPPPRDRTNSVYDPFFDRLVLTCGSISGSNATWSLDFTDGATATDIALVASDVGADHVSLTWAGAGPAMEAVVQRRVGTAPWATLARVTADGEGRLAFTDRDVAPGAAIDYRLASTSGGATSYFGATSVQIPAAAAALALSATTGVSGSTLRFQLPSAAPATLALFDVSGRRVWSRPVGVMGAGSHDIAVDRGALRPALYFARLQQAGESRTARVLVIH